MANSLANPLLRVENLVKRFGGILATDNLSLDVAPGELHAIIGPNGAGKTTLISQLTGQVMPNSGAVHFAGRDITRVPSYRRSRLGLARSFQITSLLPDFTAADNVALAAQAHDGHSFRFWGNARKEKHLRDAAHAALKRVGLEKRVDVPVSELSHGEQRELELAVALATKPQLLLLDEPMAGLGVTESARMVALLKELRKEVTIVLVEHDMEAVFALADRITVSGVRPRDRLRDAGCDPQQRRGQARLSRRPACGGCPWLKQKRRCSAGSRRHRDLLWPEPGAVRPVAVGSCRRDGRADGPQRHGQDHDRSAPSWGMTPARARRDPLRGAEVRSLPSYRIAKLGIGLVPEGRQIFPNLTVYENLVAASGNRAGNADPWTIEKIHALFPRLAERGSNMGVTLSGGEQQMLAIGRALMTNPKLLILDEATEGLAPLIREEIWNCLSMLKARGQSVLVIDKNVGNLSRIADRHYIIERGRTVWSGTSAQLIAEPDLQHRYLGI